MKSVFLATMFGAAAFCQERNVLKVSPLETIQAKPGSTVNAVVSVQIDSGFHVNSNKPADSFLIPLKLTWDPGVLKSVQISFPKPQLENYEFSTKPVSVFTGAFEIVTRFKIASDAPHGSATVSGKLHYQACNERTCLTPKTVEVKLPVEIGDDHAAAGSWVDPQTKLVWASADNGSGVSWSQASYYCRTLALGGSKNWTLPSIDELQQLFGGSANEAGFHIIGPIHLTGWQWSSTAGKEPGEQWALDFGDGGRASVVMGDSGLNRALCLRHPN